MSINYAKRRYTCFEEDPEIRKQLAEQLRQQSFLGRYQRVAEADANARRHQLRRQVRAQQYPQQRQQQREEQSAQFHRVRTQDVENEYSCLTTASSSFSSTLSSLDVFEMIEQPQLRRRRH